MSWFKQLLRRDNITDVVAREGFFVILQKNDTRFIATSQISIYGLGDGIGGDVLCQLEVEYNQPFRMFDSDPDPNAAISAALGDHGLLITTHKGYIITWHNGKQFCKVSIGDRMGLKVSMRPDNYGFVCAGSDRRVLIGNPLQNHGFKVIGEHKHDITSVGFSPDGRKVVSAGRDNIVLVIPIIDVDDKTLILKGHDSEVYSALFSLDNEVWSASYDRTVRVWSAKTGKCKKILEGHTAAVMALSMTPNGKYFVSASNDKTVRIWNKETYECEGTIPFCNDFCPITTNIITSVSIIEDKILLATQGGPLFICSCALLKDN